MTRTGRRTSARPPFATRARLGSSPTWVRRGTSGPEDEEEEEGVSEEEATGGNGGSRSRR